MHLFDKEINKRFLCEHKIQFSQRVTLRKWSIIAKMSFRLQTIQQSIDFYNSYKDAIQNQFNIYLYNANTLMMPKISIY